MRSSRLGAVLIGTGVTLTLGAGWSPASAAGASGISLGGTWGTAAEVPGTAALNLGGAAQVQSVSCASAGNCSAGGHYTDSAGLTQAFVVTQSGGTWGTAEEVPGTAALNLGGVAEVQSVSCASAGNCGAGGYYADGAAGFQAFVVSETGGTWGTAGEVPGTAALNLGSGGAGVQSVACASAGSCTAGGTYTDGAGNGQLFVVSQVRGTWGTAVELPGTAGLNQSGSLDTQLESVSCASAGNCSAGGYYADDGTGHAKAFVATETSGTWAAAEQVPGINALARGGLAQVFSVSCGAAGNCSAAGHYLDGSGSSQAFVVSETGGTWHTAVRIPGTAILNKGGLATADAVSCGATGACSAVGSYRDASGAFQAFAVSETSGTWGKAEEIPGTATLNQGRSAVATSVSCAAAGRCTAGGYYTDGSGHSQAFTVSQA